MRATAKLPSLFVLAAVSLPALDHAFVEQLLDSAKNVERDAVSLSAALKTKKVDAPAVASKIEAMSTDVAKLQELAANFESTNPQLSERDMADWKMIKEKIQLLEIFHQQKKKLASEDVAKNRTMIRAHADGVAQRAAKLQRSAAALQRAPLS